MVSTHISHLLFFFCRKRNCYLYKHQWELYALVTQGVTDPLMANVSTCVNEMIMLVCVCGLGRDSPIIGRQLKKLNKTMHFC